MTDRRTASTITDTELDQLYAERDALAADLAELTQARQHSAFTFCPQLVGHVTVAEFARKISEKRTALAQREEAVRYANQQKQRADQAEAKVTDYENRITWHTTCGSCARILDSAIQETDRRERAEAAIARVREAVQWIHRNYPGLTHVNDRLTTALNQPAPAATQATDHQEQQP
ncbi:hypothetical protein [Streptomyces naphthomycinicus]|uniref:hypothetical protein n=1 Tax=Streptomyces naphthomycinicus TaxID=2872625 RepID=UPI001CECD980|nr:hypothetical protein [Streptomyces sp. TML10]